MENFINRRLLLAKEFYSNAIDLCTHSDSLSKMLAVHNLHIAIEITLKAIFLKYEIRSEKTLNIGFDAMLSEIDSYPIFKDKDKRLPYRQEVRNLNQMRNMIQHHATEPDQNSMEDWKVIARLFLENTFRVYFDEDFQQISRISFITDKLLQDYMRKALSLIHDGKYFSAACFVVTAFEYAEISIYKLMPKSQSSSFTFSKLRRSGLDSREIEDALRKIDEKISDSFLYSTVLATGVKLSDYVRLKGALPTVMLSMNGYPNCQTWFGKEYSQDKVNWACSFVIDCIIRWQSQGLSPAVQENLAPGADQFLREIPPEEQTI